MRKVAKSKQKLKEKQRAVQAAAPVRPEVLVQKTAAAARRLAKERRYTEALQMMAQAFEAIDDADGLDPWEPGSLLTWASAQPRPVELMARFVVSLEDPDDAGFPIHEAMRCWDPLSRLAFSTWAMQVWWAFDEEGVTRS